MKCDICGKSCEYYQRAKRVKTKSVQYYRTFCAECYAEALKRGEV